MESKEPVTPWFSPHPPLTEEEARQNSAQRQREFGKDQLERWGIPRFVIVCGLILSAFYFYDMSGRKAFNSTAWKQVNAEERLSLRFAMSSDLVDSQRLIGLNRSQMIALLGKPDTSREEDKVVIYELDGLSMLVAKFDESKLISECDIVPVS